MISCRKGRKQKLPSIVSAEDDAQDASFIARSFKEAGKSLIDVRRIEETNAAYLPDGYNMFYKSSCTLDITSF